MVAQGLTTVVVMFETDGSTSLCQSSGSLVVNLQDPVSSFLMDGTGCSNMLIAADASASVFDQPLIWTIDGIQGQTPPFNLSAGTYTIGLEAQLGSCTVSSSQSITVIAPPPPIAFTANPQEGCADLEVDLTVVGNSIAGVDYNWYVDGQLYSTDFDPANLILGQGLTDTTYTIEVGAANGCGGENLAQVITVHPKPIANFGTDQSEYCSGDTVWLGNASHGDPTAVFWDFGNGQTSTEYNPPYVMYFTSTTPTTYPVTLIAYNDCGTDTLTKDIPVNPTDVNAFFNTTPTTACVGEEICFENFSTFGAAIIFDFGDGNTTTNPNPCHSYAIPGIYEVSLKAFGCGFDSIFTMVEILPLPVVDVDISPISYCPGEEISFAASTDIVVDFFWAFGDNNTAALSNPQHSYTMPGTYQVKLTGTSLAGCAQSDSILITILQPPTADFAPATDSICTGESILFNNTATNNVVSSYWEFGDGESSNEYSPSHIYENPGNYDVILVVTAGNSCPDTLMQLITVGAEPLPAFDTILNQQCTPVMVTFVNNSQNAESYEWDFGNGQTSTAANPTFIYDLGGIYAVQLTAVNGLCTRVEEQTIEVDQTPIPTTLLSDNTACAPASISFDAQEGSMLTSLNYAWDFGDGTFSFVQNVNHPYTVPGTYQVVLVVTNADSPICKDTVTEEVIIYEPVLITDTLTHILCNGASTGAIDIDPTSGTLPFAYDWSNGSVVQDQSALAAGNYVLVITDSNDCMLEEEFTLTEPAAIASITSDSSIVTCYGGDDGALCIAVSGGVADYDLQWSTGVAGACIEDVPASIYTVAITDANNCTVVDTFEVYQNPEIVLLDSVANISCYGADDGFILLQNISGGYSDFYNSVLTGPVDFNGGDAFTDLLPGDYHLLIQDLEGCTYEEDYTIGEPDSLWLDILEDSLFINMGDSIEIAVWHNAAQPVFNWSPTTGLNCPNCEDPWARPLRSTNYRVAMTDENGCPAGDIITIMVDPNRHFYIPNTFTPNGDGRNDLFRIRSRINSIRQINVFRVYDRWGELVFEAKDFRPQEENDRDAWDGTFRGRELPTETFTFYVEVAYIDGEEEVVEGTITLVR